MNWSTICVRMREWIWASGGAIFNHDHKIL